MEMHAEIIPAPRLATEHDHGSILLISISTNNMAALETVIPLYSAPNTALEGLLPTGLNVARRHGTVHVLNVRLNPEPVFHQRICRP